MTNDYLSRSQLQRDALPEDAGVDWGSGGRFRRRVDENPSRIVLDDLSLPSVTPRRDAECAMENLPSSIEHTGIC